ncbi:BQ5605_C006g04102 [Microbotryum silenes-dioicae]|uniref:BQ5605_C006g04102 protein n=1 Tax=Microbotryum silenes-dioicae TaxID=796604 RepID=A0A2X0P8C8_9BASI|nr:BQ5605_C006g04102 [Microbotryum silenes-dioicae]
MALEELRTSIQESKGRLVSLVQGRVTAEPRSPSVHQLNLAWSRALVAVVYHNTEWDTFTRASRQVYAASPGTRYTIRWGHDLGMLVLKVTDDLQRPDCRSSCIKFKTRSGAFINRFEAFNVAMQTSMHGSEPSALDQIVLEAAHHAPAGFDPKARVLQPLDSLAVPAAAAAPPTAKSTATPEMESTARGKNAKKKKKT